MLKHLGDKIIRRPVRSQHRQQAVRLFVRMSCLAVAAVALLEAGIYADRWLSAQRLAQASQSAPDRALRVVTRVSPTTYFEDERGPNGFEYALLKRFADYLGRDLEIVPSDSLADLFRSLQRQEVDLASAGLTATPRRARDYVITHPYLTTESYVVYRVGSKRPRRIEDIIGQDLVVLADSSHASWLQGQRRQHPELQWRELASADYIDVLSRIETGEIDYTIIDAAEFSLHQGFFPLLKRAYTIAEQQQIAWLMPRAHENTELHFEANRFIDMIREDGTLARLEERYLGQAAHVNQVAANEFAKSIDRQLPKYIDSIRDIAEEFSMDWRLLAAISYQESHWNPRAKSPTGVRGMMMLTLPTAREVGVTNRLDAEQSLRGGARYYQYLKNRLPSALVEPERTWFALAAYNVGFGHLQDARRLTESRGGDPNSWYDVKQTLPLLTQPKWYEQTRYGFARGYEPVQYVQNVRHYHHVLVWEDLSRARDFAGIQIAPRTIAPDTALAGGQSNEPLTPLAQLEQDNLALGNDAALLPAIALADNAASDNAAP